MTSSPPTASSSLNSVKLSRAVGFIWCGTRLAAESETQVDEVQGEKDAYFVLGDCICSRSSLMRRLLSRGSWIDFFPLMDRRKMCEWQLILEGGLFIVKNLKLQWNWYFPCCFNDYCATMVWIRRAEVCRRLWKQSVISRVRRSSSPQTLLWLRDSRITAGLSSCIRIKRKWADVALQYGRKSITAKASVLSHCVQ